MWISLDQIEALRAVDEEGSLTAASEKLHKAKSALHYSLRKLEEQVGFTLIDTGKYRGRLTAKAKQLLFHATPLLQQAEDLKEHAHRIATGVEAKVALSATALYNMKNLSRVIKELQHQFPDTEITFHREILSGEKMLRSGLVDMAIVESTTLSTEHEFRKIDSVKLYLVISSDHPFLELPREMRKKESLFQFPQVIQRSTIPDEDMHGVYQHSRRWTVSDLSSKRQIIADGLGWGRLPGHEIAEDLKSGRLVYLEEVEEAIEVPIFIGRAKDKRMGKVSRAIWEMF